MAFVRVDSDRTWVAEEGLLMCAQVIRMESADTPYVAMDFGNVLAPDVAISSVATPTEVDSKSITFSLEDVSADGQIVSFKVSGGPAAGDYKASVTVTLSDGTTNTISKRGIIRVT